MADIQGTTRDPAAVAEERIAETILAFEPRVGNRLTNDRDVARALAAEIVGVIAYLEWEMQAGRS